jgi:hypothetical protein
MVEGLGCGSGVEDVTGRGVFAVLEKPTVKPSDAPAWHPSTGGCFRNKTQALIYAVEERFLPSTDPRKTLKHIA